MTNTNTDSLRDSRRNLATLISTQTGLELEEQAAIIHGHVAIGGAPSEVQLVAAYMTDVLKIDGVTVDPIEEDEPELSIVRIPLASLEAAIAKHAA